MDEEDEAPLIDETAEGNEDRCAEHAEDTAPDQEIRPEAAREGQDPGESMLALNQDKQSIGLDMS